MIEVLRDELQPATRYFVERVWSDPKISDHATKYIGTFISNHDSFDNTVTTFCDMRYVHPELTHCVGPCRLINPTTCSYRWKFYRYSGPLISTRLHKRMLLSIGLTEDVADCILAG